jgi:hypothetical protein
LPWETEADRARWPRAPVPEAVVERSAAGRAPAEQSNQLFAISNQKGSRKRAFLLLREQIAIAHSGMESWDSRRKKGRTVLA